MPQTTNHKGYIKSSTLLLLAFATAYFPRVLQALGAPSTVNFLHFIAVPAACGLAIFQTRTRNRSQISTSKAILFGLLLLLTVIFASALLNSAGVINTVIDFLLLTEPFMLLLAIVSLPMSPERIEWFRTWAFRFALTNLFLAYAQKFAWHLELLPGEEDNIKGVFIAEGSGHVVGGSVAMTFAVYYFITAKNRPMWLRTAQLIGALYEVIISDTKQVFLAFLIALMILLLTNLKDIRKAFLYIAVTAAVFGLLYWTAYTIEPALLTWVRPEIYGPDGEATKLKLAGFRIIPSYYKSDLNWLLGLGPGHTIGRLGGWMLDKYWNLLGPLGATKSTASLDVWKAVANSWLGDKSSMFSPLFGWAGIWGDLGLLGLGTYLYLSFLVWRLLCLEDLCKYLLLTVFVFGLIFSQLEEPGYTLFVATLIGIRWQENRSRATEKPEFSPKETSSMLF